MRTGPAPRNGEAPIRIHIYDEELGKPTEVSLIRTTADTGTRFLGLRVWLKGADTLHNIPGDDDRSAVTFWAEDSPEGLLLLENLCHEMMMQVLEARG